MFLMHSGTGSLQQVRCAVQEILLRGAILSQVYTYFIEIIVMLVVAAKLSRQVSGKLIDKNLFDDTFSVT